MVELILATDLGIHYTVVSEFISHFGSTVCPELLDIAWSSQYAPPAGKKADAAKAMPPGPASSPGKTHRGLHKQTEKFESLEEEGHEKGKPLRPLSISRSSSHTPVSA